jgi:hypothetical protein
MNLNPIEVTGIFFFGSSILILCYLFQNNIIRSIIKKYWKIIVVLVLINFIYKFPIKSNYFDGLEYEDSYIYKASARAFYEGSYGFSHINPYFPTSCIYGSIKKCDQQAIFVTNFLGYPYIINLGYLIFGYHITIANIVSLIFSTVSVLFLFLASLLIINDLLFALISSFVYITIPIFNVYASTSLTEPLSNAYLILVLLLYLLFINLRREDKKQLISDILGLSSIVFTLIFAILVKTTNLSLVFCLPMAGLIYLCLNRKNEGSYKKGKILVTIPIFLIIFLFSALVFKFQMAAEINKGDIGVNPFSFSYIKALAPVFLKSFLNFKWYLFYSILFLVGVFFGIKQKKGILPIVIFFLYFVLYTAHYRSYYFTRGIPVAEDESLRYMISIVSVYSLIVGIGIFYLFRGLRRVIYKRINIFRYKSIGIAIAIVIMGISFLFTLENRVYFVEDEYISRIAPVKKTLEYLKNNDDILITSEHILFQIYGRPELKLIDFCSIENQIQKEYIDNLIRSNNVYYLQTMERSGVDEQRYKQQYSYIDLKSKELIFSDENYKLYKLTKD